MIQDVDDPFGVRPEPGTMAQMRPLYAHSDATSIYFVSQEGAVRRWDLMRKRWSPRLRATLPSDCASIYVTLVVRGSAGRFRVKDAIAHAWMHVESWQTRVETIDESQGDHASNLVCRPLCKGRVAEPMPDVNSPFLSEYGCVNQVRVTPLGAVSMRGRPVLGVVTPRGLFASTPDGRVARLDRLCASACRLLFRRPGRVAHIDSDASNLSASNLAVVHGGDQMLLPRHLRLLSTLGLGADVRSHALRYGLTLNTAWRYAFEVAHRSPPQALFWERCCPSAALRIALTDIAFEYPGCVLSSSFYEYVQLAVRELQRKAPAEHVDLGMLRVMRVRMQQAVGQNLINLL